MSANYESDGSVALKGSGFNVTVGQFSIGRGTSLTTGPTQLLRTTSGAVYAGSGVAESFALRGLGLEQTFRVARRKGGAGTLTIDLPISGLSASNQHGAIDLRNARGQVVATYSDLRVTDASGAAVSASLVASQGGHSVKIEVRDARASYPLFVDPLWQQVSELSASDGVALDRFGKSVAMFGSTAVIGAPRHYWSNNAEGAVYVFTLSGGSWSQTAELRSSDGATGDQFGTSVAISAGTLVVGAPNKTVSGHSNQGTTYVFTLSGGSWSQTAELTSSDGATGDAFGCSVSVSVPASGSSTILVGATGHAVGGNSGQGSAYVFTSSGSSWSQAAELTSSDGAAGDQFGNSISLVGHTAVVGAVHHAIGGSALQGAAYVFAYSSGLWSQTDELTSSDGAAGDLFGQSVVLSGSTIVIGADGHSVGANTAQGAAYIFNLSGSSWSQTAELTSSDGAAHDNFGSSVAMWGSTIVVGANAHMVDGNAGEGSTYSFAQVVGSGSATWTQTGEFAATDGGAQDEFSSQVAISGTTILAGAPDHWVGANGDQGTAYLFETEAQQGEVTNSDGAAGDQFGFSAAVSGTTAAIGADQHNGAQGAVYVFSLSGHTWNQTQELTASDGAAGDEFGYSVSIANGEILVGAPFHTVGGHSTEGDAYVFVVQGGTWTQSQELTSTDGTANDSFGTAVAVSGSTAVVSAPNHTVGTNTHQGVAYVFVDAAASWSQSAELSSTDGASGDDFGLALSLSGATVVVGAMYHSVSGLANEGAAYVFNWNGQSWQQKAELTASNGVAQELFGRSVSVSGPTIAIGAEGQTTSGYGAVYVFAWNGASWTQSVELLASDGVAGAYFGWSVSVSGTVLAVGAFAQAVNGQPGQGSTYLYSLAAGVWIPAGEFSSPDGTEYDQYGVSVAVSGTTVVVGAQDHTVSGNAQQGAAYMVSAGLVAPQGAPYGADSWGGGSPSEGCIQCISGTASSSSSGYSGSARPESSSSNLPDPAGEQLDPSTGDDFDTVTDVSLPGAGLPLAFIRTYDAQAAQAEEASGSTTPPLGYGWADNLGMNVVYNSATETATVTEENGSQLTFVASPALSDSAPYAWCPPTSTDFCATSPRVAATLNQNSDGSWTFTRTSGHQETFTFNSAGALAGMADPAGDTITPAIYSPGSGQTACPTGATCTAWSSYPGGSSSAARELVLAVNSTGQLTEVFDANSSLAASFTYAGSGCSSWGTGKPTDLCRAIDPGNLTGTYAYDSSNSTASYEYDLLADTPPGAAGATTNQYSSGRVTQVTDPSSDVTTYTYGGSGAGLNASFLGGTTAISSPTGVTLDTFSGNVLTSQTTGWGTTAASTTSYVTDSISLEPLAAVGGNANVTTYSYQSYNQAGGDPTSSDNLVSANTVITDAAGDTIETSYNSYNQPWCQVDAGDYANGVRCPSSAPTSPPTPGATNPNPGVSLSFYNSADQLVAATDALGDTTTYAYTSGVAGVPNGLRYCSVDPVDYQKSVVCPGYGSTHVSGTSTVTFDSSGDELTSTDADGDSTSYVYAAPGLPGVASSQTDPDGATTAFTYAGSASLIASETTSFGSYSATTIHAYDGDGRQYCEITSFEYAKGVTTCPTVSQLASNPATPTSDPWPGRTLTSYDADSRAIQTTNPIGGVSFSAYDGDGDEYCTVAPLQAAAGHTCPSTPPSTPPTPSSDPYTGATITTYNSANQVIQSTNPLGGITLTSYDPAGNVAQTITESSNASADPNVVTTHTYDADNRPTSTTVDPGTSLAQTTLNVYDPNGNVYCSVSANNFAAGSYQCPVWQTWWIGTPPSPSGLYSSTPIPSQAENVTTTFYNANGQQVQSTNPDVETNVTAVDGDGRTYCSSDPVNVASWLTAHPSGPYPYVCPSTPPTTAPSTGSNPGYVTSIFDDAGRTLSSTDQAGDTTSYTYSPGGQTLTTTDPRGEITSDCYYYQSASGQCAYGAPAGGGSADDLYSTTTPATTADPSGEVTTYTYFPGDQVDATTNPAGTATDTYDANGDLTATNYGGTASGYTTPTNLSYSYNVDGTKHTVTDATGTTTYAYDTNGDVTSNALVANLGLTNTTTSYSYYTTGVKASVVYPSYGSHTSPASTYSYDATGALVSETDWLGNKVTFGHDADGNPTSQDNNVSTANPNGTSSTALSYDVADQNTQATSTLNQSCGGSETLTQSFAGTSGSRNANGAVTQDYSSYAGSCSGQSSYQRNYSYDVAGRVVYQGSTAQGSSAANFGFDASGDPTTISSHDSSGNFDTYTQTFDNAGEVTGQSPVSGSNGASSTYSFDTLGAQTQSTTTGSAPTSYFYDQTGAMAGAVTPTGSAAYVDNANHLEAASASSTSAWGTPADSDGSTAINALACGTSTQCQAVDNTGHVLTYNGATWSAAVDVDSTRALKSISCPSSSFCAAADSSGYALTYNGTSWSSATSVDSTRSITSVSCPSSSFCAAVDSSGYALTYNGTSWSSATSVDSTHQFNSVSCPSSTFCVAVDNRGYALTYNGSSWTSGTDVDSTRSINSISCATSTFCAAVDGSGYALTYNGTSWSSAIDVDGAHSLTILTCSGAASCVTADNDGNTLAYSGTSWSTASDIDATRIIGALSCSTASPSLCAAADSSGYTVAYEPPGWLSAQNVDGTHALTSTSCPATTYCSAVDGSGNVLVYNGIVWSTATDVDSTRALKSISCSVSNFCAAVDGSGYALTDSGGTWSSASDVDSTRVLKAVSCATSTFCAAVDGSGYALTYNGTSWSSATDVDSTHPIDSVSCPSSTFCIAVDNRGYALAYNGTSWSSATDVDSTRSINSVSCPSSTFCVAVDGSGYALAYNGTSWSSATDVDSTRSISSVSCARNGSCLASDASGYQASYFAATTKAQLTWDTNDSLPLLLSDGTNDYIFGANEEPVEQISLSSSAPNYLDYTSSDDTWLSINAAGDETGYWGYDAFGNIAFGSPTSSFGFSGQYSDSATGLVNDRARLYEGQTGSFTTRDPAFGQTDTAYTYANGNPVNRVDPTGAWVHGTCLNGNIGWGLDIDGSICNIWDSHGGNIQTMSAGAGGGVHVGLGGAALVSNAPTVYDMLGWFLCATGGYGVGAGEMCMFKSRGHLYLMAELGAGFGGGGAVFWTYTWRATGWKGTLISWII